MEAATAPPPSLTVVQNPLEGFDGELTHENMELLIGRLRTAEAEALDLLDAFKERDSTIRTLEGKIARLKRERENAAYASPIWPVAVRLFTIWKAATNNKSKRSTLTVDRFFLVEPFLRDAETDRITYEPGPPRNELEECAAAIIGRAFDHFTTVRPNGTTKHFWEWNRIFKNADEKEDSAARRPRDWRDRLRELDPGDER